MKITAVIGASCDAGAGVCGWAAVLTAALPSGEVRTKVLTGHVAGTSPVAGELEAHLAIARTLKPKPSGPWLVEVASSGPVVEGWMADGWRVKAPWAAAGVAELATAIRGNQVKFEWLGEMGRATHRAEISSAIAAAKAARGG